MKVYTIPEAISFLAEEYGADRMPTSQETLRRAIRIGDLLVQEEGDPGRKGYTISEADLRTYARNRISRMERRTASPVKVTGEGIRGTQEAISTTAAEQQEVKQFYELYAQFLGGELNQQTYYLGLYKEKAKWEARLRDKKEQLINLTSMMESLKNDILTCEANIEDYQKEIKKIDF